MIKKIFKTTVYCTFFALLGLVVVLTVSAAPTQDDYLLRVEVSSKDAEGVSVSAPLALVGSLFKLMPKDISRLCEETDFTAEKLIQEIGSLEGEDLLRIEGEENIRVWFEPVTDQNRSELGFIKVKVREGGENGQNINICVPRGLVQIAAEAIKDLGLVDKYVHLPKEITELAAVNHEQ